MKNVTFDGEFVQMTGVELDVVHGRREPRHVPIMIGATGPKMMELTGEIAGLRAAEQHRGASLLCEGFTQHQHRRQADAAVDPALPRRIPRLLPRRTAPVSTDQSRTVLSSPAEAINDPSGLKAMPLTQMSGSYV